MPRCAVKMLRASAFGSKVITKRYKADNEAVAKKCALLMTRARDCWAAQEFLKREEHERLTNCALWLDIIFAKYVKRTLSQKCLVPLNVWAILTFLTSLNGCRRYKQILEEILRNEESGQKVLIAEARVVRDKRFAGMGKRRRRSNPWADDTIDPCDTALVRCLVPAVSNSRLLLFCFCDCVCGLLWWYPLTTECRLRSTLG